MNLPAEYAIKHFFPTPAFELIYSEAVANAFDADATEILINIDLDSFSNPQSLQLVIRDNGIGFTDENFTRFSNLMMVKDSQHKGLGRLVYLQYFTSVSISSVFGNSQKRTFLFEDTIKQDEVKKADSIDSHSYTELRFNKFKGLQFKSYENVSPKAIKNQLKELFMPRLFAFKKKGIGFKIEITLRTKEEKSDKGFINGTEELKTDDIAEFKTIEFESPLLDLIDSKCELLYQIETGVPSIEHRLVTALCVDGRTVPFKIATDDQLPHKTKATFMLESSFLNAKTNDSRQELVLKPGDSERIARVFMDKVAEVLYTEIPEIQTQNKKIKDTLAETYPHLAGYFNQKTIGIINRNRVITEAQTAFCKDEKEILEAKELSDEQYMKSLEQASRVLAQYILYRNKIIHKMEAITANNQEADIHNLIVPMRHTFDSFSFYQDIYNNNAWLLDDKYMTYQSILSDQQMKELMEKVMGEDEKRDVNLRPDIAFVFSENIEKVNHKVDVVVVELKRKGLDYLGQHIIIEQIRQRARRLVSVYPDKIQRLWFFGVIEFNAEIRIALKESHWTHLYSKGESYYTELDVLRVDENNNELSGGTVPVAVTLLSLEALWKDALARNETFLSVLKESIKQTIKE